MSPHATQIGRQEAAPPPGATVLVSYPQSGRTWLRYMLDQLDADFQLSHGGARHVAKLPFEAIENEPAKYRACRVLFLFRDPRDTAVSGFFQTTRRKRAFDGDMAAFLRDPLHGIEKIVRFNLLWTRAARTFTASLTVRYEDLQRDTREEFARSARFVLGRDARDDAVAAAVDAGAFDRMRSVESSGEGGQLYGAGLRPRDPRDPDSFKVRRGIVGGWRDYFSAADAAYAEDLFDRHGYRPLLADGAMA